ncbi:sensor histidine kinase [Clostridium neonatale]|uniref:Sensor histidine kinase n=1 Tax=Clostridium neonatale TaxID=137838 RepID=A0A2A7MIM3_9CLOT|nr:histidine kinase [Clostridium neonatale]PEG27452.1 sensor histidine kinase [Clostridium neonatale]PEG31161.1 sensor histidine kinase [Clostridium neonatale]CAI3248113.1 putative two-component sensor histidine kinase [Clostridium neonatale]CAI3622850.1 putative two-component sensor histidine kinase [Clostridium neonatale]
MYKISKFMHSTSLFFRVAFIVLISIICVFLLTCTITISISKDVLVDTFSKSNYKILNQITDRLGVLNDNIINIMNVIDSSSDFENYLTLTNVTSAETFKTLYNMDITLDTVPEKDFNDITLLVIGRNGESFLKGHNYFKFDTDEILNSDLTQNAVLNSNVVFYQYSEFQLVNAQNNSSAITAVKVLCDDKTKEIYGFVYVIISQDDFKKYYVPFVGTSNNIAIISNDGQIVSSSIPYEIGSTNNKLLDISNKIQNDNLQYYNTNMNNKDVAILSKYLPRYNFNIVGIIEKSAILNEVYNTSQIYFVTIIIALIFLLITFVIIRRTTKPLYNLSYKMSQVTDGNFKNYVKVEGSYEVRQLSYAYNYMLDGLNSYMNERMEMEKEKRKAEIHALQMQINPHFLYNTLSSIKWLIWQGNTDKSIKTIDAFISLLRNTISNKNEMITISEEIENLKNYVLINHMRYGESITVNFFVMQSCENYIIPKLILQPFIENSFFHGFVDKNSGFIHVFINKKNHIITCEIIDNGVGISNETIPNLLKTSVNKSDHFTSIGINNVNDRIKLLYGDEYGVVISSEINVGTTVKIKIPAIKKSDLHDSNQSST